MEFTAAQLDLRPRLSIVVLCYNQAGYIGDCLRSILSQDPGVAFEVIVGDDGSGDDSVAVIETFRSQYPLIVKLVQQRLNVGYSRNFAAVIAATSGDYIACIDGDDMMLPGKLRRQIEFLDAHDDYGMVVHKMQAVDFQTKEPVDFPLPRLKPIDFDAEYLIEYGPYFFCSSAMFRGALRRRYAVDLNLKVVADVANLMQSVYGTRGRYLDEELGLYRVNPVGFTSTVIRNPRRHETNVSDMLYTFRMADEIGMAKDVVNRGRARLYLRSAIVYLEAGYFEDFRRCIEASVQVDKVGVKQAALHLMRSWPHALRRSYMFAKRMAGRKPMPA